MTAVAALFFQALACLGFGATILRALQIASSLSWLERLTWSFIVGAGVVGWLVFFLGTAGTLSTIPLSTLLAIGCLGLLCLGIPRDLGAASFTPLERLLLAALAVTLGFDCFEGIAPPGDADSLAYHFNLPKEFLRDQQITFVPRAIDGAAPLLVQMTYIPALGLGGEKALTLWTMVSSWGVAFALYCFCRNHVSRAWALAATLLWLTTPAVLYGGGSGQVEVRIAGFVLVAVGALMRARQTGLARWVALAGLATGMYVGTKYTGLMFGAACGLVLFGLRHWPKQMLVFGATSIAVGFQWYFWNWLHTGDPVFPMLFKVLGPENYSYWNQAFQNDLERFYFGAENAVPNNPLWMLLYPFLATFSSDAKFDSERIGLGPFMLLVLPMVVAGLWTYRDRITQSAWCVPALVVAGFYCLWFLTGSSQRIRHLVPLYPVLLVLVLVVLSKWADDKRRMRLVCLSFVLTLSVQFAGQGASSLNYLRYGLTDETRDEFLERNVSGYGSVQWMNDHLKPSDRVLVTNRQLLYLINSPTYFGQTVTQMLVDLSPRATDMRSFFHQLKSLNITHILGYPERAAALKPGEIPSGVDLWKALVEHNCAEIVNETPYRHVVSRSLSHPQQTNAKHYLVRLTDDRCVAPR